MSTWQHDQPSVTHVGRSRDWPDDVPLSQLLPPARSPEEAVFDRAIDRAIETATGWIVAAFIAGCACGGGIALLVSTRLP